ncbi:DUF3035 domain-containing protein [Candidatus Pelagibacter sp.]|mgnify:CR=1 FL=1|nr:DUF3035 domain-containing protein [Candidatus Pelagibacter sp.]|tara:strand:- start:266 stop:577 length:312 start_codon:yes stop_codon:yes gene_type:complete
MKKFKYFIYLILTFSLVSSCGTVKEGFTNQKKNSSDEFLVEKKSPLVMPPEFDKLPIPEMKNSKENFEENTIQDLITNNKNNNNSNKTNEDLGNSILEKIKNN